MLAKSFWVCEILFRFFHQTFFATTKYELCLCECMYVYEYSPFYFITVLAYSETPSRAHSRHSPTYQWYVCRFSHSVLRFEANLYIFFPFNSVWKSSKLHGFFHFVSQFFTYILTVCLNWVSMFPILVCFNQWPLLWYEFFSKRSEGVCKNWLFDIWWESEYTFLSSLPLPISPYHLLPKKKCYAN